ncbi:MAG: hypothetical protein J07HB67_00983, partial [halophilic archaeon J07HB67]
MSAQRSSEAIGRSSNESAEQDTALLVQTVLANRP